MTTKRIPAKAAPAPVDVDQVVTAAVEAAFETWRNTPGRAAYVRNALVACATEVAQKLTGEE